MSPGGPADPDALEELLAEPSARLVEDMARLDGDLVVLGAGGKMGPSLCRLARAALDAAGRGDLAVHAVSRWSDPAAARRLERHGVRTLAFDLMDPAADLGDLPDARNLVHMAGAKFGTAGDPSTAWAVNAGLPERITRRWPAARISAFSTGNVYPLVPVGSGGCAEDDPVGPVGEYAMSCLGRERMLEHAARSRSTPVAILRLNYAVDLRYGVLADVGSAVLAGEPVDLTTGHANLVWQGYANEVALRALHHASADPPFTLNLTGPETVSVRRLAHLFGREFGLLDGADGAGGATGADSADRASGVAVGAGGVPLTGTESPTALLSDAGRCHALFGYPRHPLHTLVAWQADWLRRGQPLLGKPTRFQVRDGRF